MKAASRNLETARVERGQVLPRRRSAAIDKQVQEGDLPPDRQNRPPAADPGGLPEQASAEAAAEAEREATAARLKPPRRTAAEARERQAEEAHRKEERQEVRGGGAREAPRGPPPPSPSPAPVAEPVARADRAAPAFARRVDADAAAEEALKAAKRAEAAAKAARKRAPTGLVSRARAVWEWAGDDFSVVIPYIMEKDPAALRTFAEEWMNSHVRKNRGRQLAASRGSADSIPGVKMSDRQEARNEREAPCRI